MEIMAALALSGFWTGAGACVRWGWRGADGAVFWARDASATKGPGPMQGSMTLAALRGASILVLLWLARTRPPFGAGDVLAEALNVALLGLVFLVFDRLVTALWGR